MEERHLLPNEIDLLLDGEVGFGVTPLRAHADACAVCGERLAGARVVVEALDRLPHFAPSLRFSDEVMARVQIVEPWYLAALDTARRLVPRSQAMRLVMAASATFLASVMSASAVWLAFRADAALYALNLVANQSRAALVSGAGTLIGNAFGQSGLEVVRTAGVGGLAIGGACVLAAAGGATFGFRALASSSRRVRA